MSIFGPPVGGDKGRLQQRSFDRGGEEIIERERWGAENVRGKQTDGIHKIQGVWM